MSDTQNFETIKKQIEALKKRVYGQEFEEEQLKFIVKSLRELSGCLEKILEGPPARIEPPKSQGLRIGSMITRLDEAIKLLNRQQKEPEPEQVRAPDSCERLLKRLECDISEKPGESVGAQANANERSVLSLLK